MGGRWTRTRDLIIKVYDKILYGFIYLWTGIYTRHAQHPRIAKFIFYQAVIYAVILLVALTHTYTSVKNGLYMVFPKLKNASSENAGHAENCSDWSFRNIMKCIDVFVLAHFVGYAIRGVVFRNNGFCWLMSITWEITELAFIHLNSSFIECWWDAIILDVFTSNAVGIWFGMYMCKRLQLKMFHWDSNILRHEDDGSCKERRRVLRWQASNKMFGQESAFRRVLPIAIILVVSQIEELNFFLMKKLLYIPPGHVLCLFRTYVISTMASPAVLEAYDFVVSGKRFGNCALLWLGIIFVEFIVCLKFGVKLFKQLKMSYMLYWILIQVFLSFVYLWISTRRSNKELTANTIKNGVECENSQQDSSKSANCFQNGGHNGYAINTSEPQAAKTRHRSRQFRFLEPGILGADKE